MQYWIQLPRSIRGGITPGGMSAGHAGSIIYEWLYEVLPTLVQIVTA
jgi:hypothetical protein